MSLPSDWPTPPLPASPTIFSTLSASGFDVRGSRCRGSRLRYLPSGSGHTASTVIRTGPVNMSMPASSIAAFIHMRADASQRTVFCGVMAAA